MMVQPLAGSATYPTKHCVTGALRHVYDFHGRPVSEERLLGPGRGLGFAYFHITGTDPFYGGRANHERPGEEGLERTVGRRTGVRIESHTTSSARTAQQTLREVLERCDFAAARQPTAEEVRTAIREVCAGMLEPPIRNLGVKGIRKAMAEIADREQEPWTTLDAVAAP